MNAREFIVLVLNAITAHRSAVIITFLVSFTALYIFIPFEWQTLLSSKSPVFLPFGLNLFDIIAVSAALLGSLVVHFFLYFLQRFKLKLGKLNPRKIKNIVENELDGTDRSVLVYLVYGKYLDKDHPTVRHSLHKLKSKGLIKYGYMGVVLAKSEVESFVHNQVEAGVIDLEKLFPEDYR